MPDSVEVEGTLIGQHVIPDGSNYCHYCGTSRKYLSNDPTTPCTRRTTEAPVRDFHSAMDDVDSIHEGIQRLQREHDESMRRTSTELSQDQGEYVECGD